MEQIDPTDREYMGQDKARELYESLCRRMGLTPNWAGVPDDLRRVWINHACSPFPHRSG